ncbi:MULTISPECIES: TetR/AcrR family transcriptional regulator [unclassified Caballeronia]|uniref:TetR/AcrR family transcriptional regulator n=1 Tax=unclassified Caballeronia TaxID=2646786 RepID=UPI002859F4C7|nr:MULTISPECIES: TetR/AcrR family transcriptional regulator [unclassified Caballeronia]MDR5750764.1 TetR/AcrR family transcriptional regulator [Caballeronia sp. LZ024]MDR5842203.1 TetR/AcrR family transcriptional regulator [Caballeronia sp. LZ031]
MGIQERRTEQRQAVRERILSASREIVGREGFAALSMRKIAEAIDYSPAALYLHFKSRAEIARALRSEGYAQLLTAFAPHASIVDAAERLKAMGRAYVEFGLGHCETYRLMFMEASGVDASAATVDAAKTLSLVTDAFVELRAAGRLPAQAPAAACAEALWANLHGIVALAIVNSARSSRVSHAPHPASSTHSAQVPLPRSPAEALAELSLDAWFGRDPGRA